MAEEIRIIVTGVGSGVSQSIIKALNYANMHYGRNYHVFGTDASWKAAGLYRLEKAFLVPRCQEPEYLPRISQLCREYQVDFLIPGTDPELPVLEAARALLERETKTHVLVNSANTVWVGYDKLKTSIFLKENGFPFPRTKVVSSHKADVGGIPFPLIVKPRYGSGSVGLGIVNSVEELENYLLNCRDEMVAQELIEGIEYTCGLAFGRDGRLLSTIILERKLKKGFTQFARVVTETTVETQIRAIAGVLEGRGAYNVQGRLTEKGFYVFEINPRFSGTTAFRAVAGQNEPDIYIQHYLYGRYDKEIVIRPLCMSRYLNECYFNPEQVQQLQDNDELAGACEGFLENYF